MKKHDRTDQHGGPDRPVEVSAATRQDLALAEANLAEAERLRAEATVSLARVRARGDGEAAAGMTLAQHLRWKTRVRRETVTAIGVITDVAPEPPTVINALDTGAITLDQASAVAWPAARVSRHWRTQLDAALAREDGWTSWSPESLRCQVETILEELQPAKTEAEQQRLAEQQWLRLEPTLDGQGLRGQFQAHGIDAALINATLDKAADGPQPTEPDPDGVLVGRTIRRLEAEGARRIEVFAANREIVAVKGRAGHTMTDPGALSEETTRILVTLRDRTCRMPGCDRPVEHLHHLIHQGQPGSSDDPINLAGLCLGCHRTVHRWTWSGTVGTVARMIWTRAGPTGHRTTTSTTGRLATRLRPSRPDPNQVHLDPFGDPLPF